MGNILTTLNTNARDNKHGTPHEMEDKTNLPSPWCSDRLPPQSTTSHIPRYSHNMPAQGLFLVPGACDLAHLYSGCYD